MKKQSVIKSEKSAKRVIDGYITKLNNILCMFTTEYNTYEVELDETTSTNIWKVITVKSGLHTFNGIEMEEIFKVANQAKKNYRGSYYCMRARTYQGNFMMMAEPVIEINFRVYPQETAGEK